MKIWTDKCDLKSYFSGDSEVKFGIGWYRHSKDHKWWGLTIQFYMYFYLLQIHFVSNYTEYDKRMNYRYSDGLKKRAERRLAKLTKKKENGLEKK